MVWRREEGIGSSGQVVGRPAVTRREISSGERGEKEVRAYTALDNRRLIQSNTLLHYAYVAHAGNENTTHAFCKNSWP
jgi:hypothetical protein